MVVLHDNSISKYMMPDKSRSNGSTFTQAIKDKYVNQQELQDKLVLPKDEKISTEIIFVGFGKVLDAQKQLKCLTSIDLSNNNITSAGDFNDLIDSLNRVSILNLANNLLPFNEIVNLLHHFPRLKELILTNNPLEDDAQKFTLSKKLSLTSLTLGKLHLDWPTTMRLIARVWDSIEQLDLWNCDLTPKEMKKVECEESKILIRSIKVLKLSHNHFQDLNWFKVIGPFENLIELDLSNCGLESFLLDDSTVKCLCSLTNLNISYNNLNSWTSISNLHRLKNLKSIICHENPFFISEKNSKILTIGYLGQILFVNREEITPTTRRDSEVFYIRKFHSAYRLFNQGKDESFKSHHPRYEELAHTYGIPEDLSSEERIVDKYVTVDLCHKERRITKKLPRDMRIANVQMLCKRLFNLKPSSSIVIVCRHKDRIDGKLDFEFDQDGQTLDFFSVKNGHELLIKES